MALPSWVLNTYIDEGPTTSSMYQYRGLLHPRDRALHPSLLNFMRFLIKNKKKTLHCQSSGIQLISDFTFVFVISTMYWSPFMHSITGKPSLSRTFAWEFPETTRMTSPVLLYCKDLIWWLKRKENVSINFSSCKPTLKQKCQWWENILQK